MRVTLLFLFVALCFGCQQQASFDYEKAKADILILHRLQEQSHVEKDAQLLIRQFSDDFITVNSGIVSTPSKAESETMFRNYFSQVNFLKWEDSKEPIVRFSDDGSLAYTIVEKDVIFKFYRDGELLTEDTHFAWTAIYRNTSDGWKLEAMSSTNEDPEIKRVEE